jgi:hypothetical protein
VVLKRIAYDRKCEDAIMVRNKLIIFEYQTGQKWKHTSLYKTKNKKFTNKLLNKYFENALDVCFESSYNER